jgi:DNA-directed RNA polymerase specialized sigma24 family protein
MKPSHFQHSSTKQLHELLFKAFAKQLVGYGIKTWKLEEDIAWELCYQCLDKVVEKQHSLKFSSEKQLQAYVFKVYINLLKNKLRGEKNKPVQDDQAVDELAERQIELKESSDIQSLKKLLDQLEDWQRILMLMRAQGFSYREISKYAGKKPQSLKVYYSRLKKEFLEKLKVKENG